MSKIMRFTNFSVPDSNQWMEKSDILFLIDCCSRETPFVSRSLFEEYELVNDKPLDLIYDRVHPHDLEEFKKVIDGRSTRPAHYKLRIIDRDNNIQSFSFHKLKSVGNRKNNLLLAISKKQSQEPVMVKVPVNW